MRPQLSSYVAWASCLSCAVSEKLVAERNGNVQDGRIEERQQPGAVAANIFYRRGYHSSVVAGNFVYIDGGAFSYNQGGSLQILYATETLSIDMSKSWTNSSVAINSFSKPSGVPFLDDGNLWYNEKAGTLQEGFTGAAPRFDNPETAGYPLGTWSFKLDGQGGGTWSKDDGSTNAIRTASLTRPYQGLSAFGGGIAINIGGYENDRTVPGNANLTDKIPIRGIVTYDMNTGKYTNSSAAGYNFNGTAERGVVHYVPSFGPKGVFVILSGDVSPLDEYQAAENIQNFNTVTLYDPATGNFFNQTTTGNIPDGRIEFCTAGANSTNGTYEIFMYAGWGGRLGTAALPFDSMYILTLPAFQWIKVSYPAAKPRHGLTCETVGRRQMLTIGGVDTLQGTPTSEAKTLDLVTFATRDQFAQGLAIFDMTALSWSSGYDANAAAYEQSDPVKNYYASNSREPAKWGSQGLKDLFSVTHFTNSTSGSSAPASDGSNSDGSKKSNAGAIAGGVVGGLLGLALIAGLIFFLMRRKRRNAATELPTQDHHNSTTAMGGAAMGQAPPGGYMGVPTHNHDAASPMSGTTAMSPESSAYQSNAYQGSGYQGEYRGDHKPYTDVVSEAPGPEINPRPAAYPTELSSQPQHFEMDARPRHELA